MDLNQHNKILVKFYNRVSGDDVTHISDIPEDALKFLIKLRYNQLIEPFVIEDLCRRRGTDWIAKRYRVTRWTIRMIKKNAGAIAQM